MPKFRPMISARPGYTAKGLHHDAQRSFANKPANGGSTSILTCRRPVCPNSAQQSAPSRGAESESRIQRRLAGLPAKMTDLLVRSRLWNPEGHREDRQTSSGSNQTGTEAGA